MDEKKIIAEQTRSPWCTPSKRRSTASDLTQLRLEICKWATVYNVTVEELKNLSKVSTDAEMQYIQLLFAGLET